MESFDLFFEQLVPLASKQHEDFVLSERKRRHPGYHGNQPPGVMLEQLKRPLPASAVWRGRLPR